MTARSISLLTVLTALGTLVGLSAAITPARAADATPAELTPAQRGFRHLTETPYVPHAFTEADFAEVWRAWPEPLRAQAEQAPPAERRRMAFARYGLTTRPGDDSGKPLQYVVTPDGRWTMNCLACHTGAIQTAPGESMVIPGLPNANYLMETLTDEIREAKLLLNRPLIKSDYSSIVLPLGKNVGTTNAVMFGVVLMGYRDADLNVHLNRLPPRTIHHDMEAPPWWHFHRKHHIYIDGFAEKGHRGLMQFALDRSNGPEKFRGWEAEFQDVKAYLESLRAPKYPRPIDQPLAARGEKVFSATCASCHGTYGPNGKYPETTVAIDDVGTDRVRLDALTDKQRAAFGTSWFADYGRQKTIAQPAGYVAPPLDGIWASGPYFHNGSVPTLWHVLHPSERPKIWKRTGGPYDFQRLGQPFEAVESVPLDVTKAERRMYFDTGAFGKSAQGHDYPDQLSEDEKLAVLEYLKSL